MNTLKPTEKTREIAATKSGFSSATQLERAKSVVASNDEELIEAMDSGKLSISAAAKTVSLPQHERKAVISAADPKKALRESTLVAASGRLQAQSNKNPHYKPNENYKALAVVTSYCDIIAEKIEVVSAGAMAETIIDEGMRKREIITIRRCIEALTELMEEINV